MKTMQLREAKASFSALVEAAENGQPTIITKHGKPAAAIVPVDVAVPKPARPKPLPLKDAEKSVRAFVAEFSAAEPDTSAVADLVEGRR